MKLIINIPDGKYCLHCPILSEGGRCLLFRDVEMEYSGFQMLKHKYCNPDGWEFWSNYSRIIDEDEQVGINTQSIDND